MLRLKGGKVTDSAVAQEKERKGQGTLGLKTQELFGVSWIKRPLNRTGRDRAGQDEVPRVGLHGRTRQRGGERLLFGRKMIAGKHFIKKQLLKK